MDEKTKLDLSYRILWISGIFCLLVALLLILNYWQMTGSDPVESATIEALVERLKSEPNNEQLKKEIRSFDLLARKAYFTSRWQVKTGAYLLLFGGIVFAVALKIYTDLRSKIEISGEEETGFIQGRILTQRWILFAGSAVMILALVSAFFSNDYLKDYEFYGESAQGTVPSGEDQPEIIEIVEEPSAEEPQPAVAVVDTTQDFNAGKNREEEEGATAESDHPEDATSSRVYFGIEDFRKNHNAFRGLFGHGVDYHKDIPVDWDGSSGKNVLWKVAVPRSGYNSPVIWKDKIFLSGADMQSGEVYCYNRHTGQLMWRKTVDQIPGSPASPPRVTDDTGLSAPSMVTDGHRVYAIFATGDIIAFDLEGNRIWARNLGVPDNHYGHSSSLQVWNNRLVVQYDTGKGGRMLVLNTLTGETLWDIKRDNKISWASPILIQVNNKFQIVTSADPYVAGHDLENGEALWKVEAMMGEVGPSPAYDGGVVYATNEYARLVAVKPGATGTEYVWENDEYLSEASSPVAAGGLLYLATSYGVLVCYDGKTGEKYWEKEYDHGFYSSPMVSDGKVYAIDLGGIMHILRADRTGTEIGSPALGEEAYATPAFADQRIYLRGKENLYCIGD
ncbi:MAG: PQQ-binding-like beta-propeller repeat protein [Bacteroidales bacterium]|nr:PQQ-binding-like beta-propeller repeat protein [Bacteroidales bacterium]